MSTESDTETIRRLVEGELPWDELRNDILPDPKDSTRFETTREVLQERVDWDEPILVPLNDHLHVVGSDDGRIVKADCGHELCDVADNWKLHTEVNVREEPDEFERLYSEQQSPHPDWGFQLREFFCPGCYQLIEVEAVPTGYPIVQKFEPDIDAFYEEWLGRPAPDRKPDRDTE